MRHQKNLLHGIVQVDRRNTHARQKRGDERRMRTKQRFDTDRSR
jgi:hypothetical protein